MTFPPVLDVDWSALAPAITLLVTAVATLFFALFHKDSRPVAGTALIGVVTAFVFALARFLEPGGQPASFGLRYFGDTWALGFTFVILVGTAVAIGRSNAACKNVTTGYQPRYGETSGPRGPRRGLTRR